MRTALLLLTLITSIALSGQNRFSIESFGALGIGKSPNNFLDQFADQELILLSRYGVGGSIPVTGNFYFRTGFQVSEYGHRFSQELTIANVNGTELVAREFDVQSRNRQAELLFLVRYEIPTYLLVLPYFEVGLASTMYIHTKDNFNPNLPISSFDPSGGEAPYQLGGVKQFNAVARIGAGASFNLLPKAGLFVGLVGQRYISSAAEEGLANVYPWRIDLEVGVRYFPGK